MKKERRQKTRNFIDTDFPDAVPGQPDLQNPAADGSGERAEEIFFMVELVQMLCGFCESIEFCKPCSRRVWSFHIYVSLQGDVYIPVDFLLYHLPLIFFAAMLGTPFFAVFTLFKNCHTTQGMQNNDDEEENKTAPKLSASYKYHFMIVWCGTSVPYILLLVKCVIHAWGTETHFLSPDLFDLWRNRTISAIELASPLISPFFVASFLTLLAYDYYACAATLRDVADELDQLGAFRQTQDDESASEELRSEVADFFRAMHSIIDVARTGTPKRHHLKLKRFKHLPFIETPLKLVKGFEVSGFADYAKKWAAREVGELHPIEQAWEGGYGWCSLFWLALFALLPALLPYSWMKLTHGDEYLQHTYTSVKTLAVISVVLTFVAMFVAFTFWWCVSQDFEQNQLHFLNILFISSSESGRRALHRMWPNEFHQLGLRERHCEESLAASPNEIRMRRSRNPGLCFRFPSARYVYNDGLSDDETPGPTSSLKFARVELPLKFTSVPSGLGESEEPAAGCLLCDCVGMDAETGQSGDVTDHSSGAKILKIYEQLRDDLRCNAFEDSDDFAEDEKDITLLQSLKKHDGLLNMHVLDVEKFLHLRAFLKPSIFLTRFRLEACFVFVAVVAMLMLSVVLIDWFAPPVGSFSCIGAMAVYFFLLSSFFLTKACNLAININTMTIESSVEVLEQWKGRIMTTFMKTKRLDDPSLKQMFSKYRMQFDSKFHSILEPFDHGISMLKAEQPMSFAFLPATRTWRNALVASTLVSVASVAAHSLWAFITSGVSLASGEEL